MKPKRFPAPPSSRLSSFFFFVFLLCCWTRPGSHAVSRRARLPGSDSAAREDGAVEPDRLRLPGETLVSSLRTFVAWTQQ